MFKKMNQRKKDMLVNLHYRPPMWGVESGKTLPFNHVPEGSGFRMVPTSKVPRENLGGGSYGRRFPEGSGLIIFKNCPNIKGSKRKSGRRLCHVRRFPEGFGLRMVPTSKVPRENPGGGSYGRRFPEGSG